MTRTTIDDVAARAGVSIKTVSRVVNNEPNVSEKTRAKVQAVVDELDYRPNAAARSLASKRSYLIALLYDNPSANYVIDIQQGTLERCEANGFNVLIHPCDSRDPDIANAVMNMLKRSRVDGVILTSPLAEMPQLSGLLEQNDIPYVRVGLSEDFGEFPGVYCNDRKAAYEITQFLIEQGHQRIGFIKGLPSHSATTERYAGFCQAMDEAGYAIEPHLVMNGEFSFESGKVIAREIFTYDDPPSAIFASNDDMASGVLYAATKLGIQVPGELSIVGFDNNPLSKQLYPTLTTVEQPIKDMATQATDILLTMLRQSDYQAPCISLTCKLKKRDSVGPPIAPLSF